MTTEPMQRSLLAGVIGSPIAHSKSPKLHNYWLRYNQIDGFYIPVEVQPETLKTCLNSLITLGFRGVNVTIPHKIEVLALADTVTDRAAIIGAANTLYFNSEGKITADNTDSYGFKKNLYHYFPDWKPEAGPAVVFGAGGAAKAIVHSLLEEGAPSVKILNRTKVKARAIADNFGNKVEVVDWYAIDEVMDDANTVVNTTSLGLIGQPELKISFKNLKSGALVTDLVYNPVETEFLKEAKKAGFNTVDGLGMLIYQAELGFRNWFGFNPKVNDDVKLFLLENDV